MRNFLSCCLAVWAAAATLAFAFRPEEPACVIALDKMNIFHIGVDNPVSILVRGVPEEEIKIETSENLTLEKRGGLSYNVRAYAPGEATLTVSGGPLKPITFNYRVKRFPEPAVLLGAQHFPRTINIGTFKAQAGLAAVMQGYDISGNCEMISYKVTQLRNGRLLADAINTGARYTHSVQTIISDAQSGDTFIYEDVKVKCPGDTAPRTFEGLTFVIR